MANHPTNAYPDDTRDRGQHKSSSTCTSGSSSRTLVATQPSGSSMMSMKNTYTQSPGSESGDASDTLTYATAASHNPLENEEPSRLDSDMSPPPTPYIHPQGHTPPPPNRPALRPWVYDVPFVYGHLPLPRMGQTGEGHDDYVHPDRTPSDGDDDDVYTLLCPRPIATSSDTLPESMNSPLESQAPLWFALRVRDHEVEEPRTSNHLLPPSRPGPCILRSVSPLNLGEPLLPFPPEHIDNGSWSGTPRREQQQPQGKHRQRLSWRDWLVRGTCFDGGAEEEMGEIMCKG